MAHDGMQIMCPSQVMRPALYQCMPSVLCYIIMGPGIEACKTNLYITVSAVVLTR